MTECKNCGRTLTEEQIKYNWNFGKIWFCRTTCAIAWAVKKIIEIEQEKKGWQKQKKKRL